MKRTDYVRCTEDENSMGDRVVLFYYLTESKLHEGASRYGVGVEMYVQLPDCRTSKESAIVENVCSDRQKAERLIDVLCAGTVPPMTLSDIITDYLDTENDEEYQKMREIM